MKFFIQTFGCQMNENDSAMICSLLQKRGMTACTTIEDADVILINTCCVRQNAENRALGFIGSIKKLKDNNPALTIVVCGCMSQREGVASLLQKSYRHVGIIIGTFAAARLPEYIAAYQANGQRIVDVDERYGGTELTRTLDDETLTTQGYRGQVNINYGCNNFCSYCIVPYVRGRERSRKPAEILAEISAMVSHGMKEVQLLGQNVNSYGKDFQEDGVDFADLLKQIHAIDGLERIRYMTSHPRDFSQRLLDTIAVLPKVCRHFHLPVQSGCDRLLKLMNRGYTSAYYYGLLEQIRSRFPDAVITTDLIVGFPGETEEDFQTTLAFIEKCQFDSAYTFLYSRRSGTPAAKMPDQVPEEIKHERIQRLAAVQDPISLAKNEQMIASLQQVMVEGPSRNNPNMFSGRTDGNKIVIFPAEEKLSAGDMVQVRICEAKTWNLVGEIIK